MKEMQPVLI